MALNLPDAVATYLAAEREKNLDMLALCFSRDAVVHDEGRDYRGIDAITSWKRAADEKYQYVLEPLDSWFDGKTVNLRARLTGDFPGSPVEVDYVFTLSDDRIASLQIQ